MTTHRGCPLSPNSIFLLMRDFTWIPVVTKLNLSIPSKMKVKKQRSWNKKQIWHTLGNKGIPDSKSSDLTPNTQTATIYSYNASKTKLQGNGWGTAKNVRQELSPSPTSSVQGDTCTCWTLLGDRDQWKQGRNRSLMQYLGLKRNQ